MLRTRSSRWLWVAGSMCVGAGVGAALLFFSRGEKGGSPEKYTPRPHGQLTFTKDVAPIIFQQCASCHRPGQSAPFSLLTLDEMRKHATDIADLTRRRVMPPWLPEHGYGEFAGERRLSVDELGVIQQWIAEGANEGRALDLPPVPTWSGDWQLGTPDLIVTMPEPYNMLAEGRDVNRNFVVPVPISAKRYVKSVEFHPGNPKIVHHAFIKVDRTGQSRLLDSEDPEPGFPGINPPAESPASDFLGWQPGRRAEFGRPGLSWPLEPGNDLVFQMHLSPSGKPEQLQSSVGLYFTDQPPTNTCLKLLLTSLAMDIPAGASDYVVEDSYRLPVDVELLGLLPHAHYLAREMEAWATLPNGTREWLLLIKHWDFNWQGAYRYTKPVSLPKGSTLQMRFTYDNSTNNARNPNVPPKAVSYGPQSRDEMAELWLQVLAHNDNELTRLKNDHEIKMARVFLESDLAALRRDPNDARAHTDLGMALLGEGKLADAEPHFQAALRAQPAFALAHYDYALLLRRLSRFDEAEVHFREDLRLAPHDFKAHGNLGAIFLQQGNLDAAQAEFQSALAINPEDSLARQGLEMLRRQRNP